MAAYAALVSLMHIINQIQNHPRPPISLDQTQVESLIENIIFLQKFLQDYSSHVSYSKEADALEMRIADAAYGGEDVIESYIVDQIHAGEEISSVDFDERLRKVIENMDFIKTEATEIIKEKMGDSPRDSSVSVGSSRSPSTWQNVDMVGSEDILNEALDKLTGQQYSLQIIPIVGMGGIGKTTLARNIYANPLIVEHFDILAWITISQEYSRRDVLLQVLCQKNGMNDLSHKSEEELGEISYKDLWGRRYLVVMDDIWDNDAWNKVKFFFPDNNNGSRILMTTRLSNLSFELTGSYGLQMNYLDEDKSWILLCKIVFGKEDCPLELEEIGRKIAKNTRGLPLLVVLIGGLLKYSKTIKEYWEYTLTNLSSVINLEDNERCVQTLYTSYKELPVHLKPCFLYMGIFPEDRLISVSKLIKLWVAEGFLKPIDGKSLEVAAEEYLEELVVRNLILVHKLRSNGKTKYCIIHDLLRDLCLREAQKQKFLCVRRPHSLQGIDTERRVIIHRSTSDEKYDPLQVFNALQSASLARSLIVDQDHAEDNVADVLGHTNLRLLRVFKVDRHSNLGDIDILYNLRYFSSKSAEIHRDFSFLIRHWNLHTIITRGLWVNSFPEIWELPQLRHVELLGVFEIPNPSGGRDKAILGNLQTLFHTYIENCIETVIERIPNIKKLKAFAWGDSKINFDHLLKLEHLDFYFRSPIKRELQQNLNFPHSLKKLILQGCELHWEDVITKIGSLPLLEILQLMDDSVKGPEWVTVEGKFCNLKYLKIRSCDDLVYWTTENSHFPRLEHLHLLRLPNLEEVPSVIGEIPTLQSINLYCRRNCVVVSVLNILKKQQELGYEGLRVHAEYDHYDEATGVWRSRFFNRISPLEDNGQD